MKAASSANNHLSHPRPIGPRSLHPSPLPQPLVIEPTAPLNIRKSSASLATARSPPTLTLPSVHSAGSARASTPKGSLKLSISAVQTVSPPTYYGGGATPPPVNLDGSPEDVTMKPPLAIAQQLTQKPPASIDDITHTLTEITLSAASGARALSGEDPPPQYSDDILEEMTRLGEGAGGAVHKVKDKRTGTIMARKTLTTREAPMKQLLRELSIISSTQHRNITVFYGVYMSPSSSEVKILMEFCEGGSLETIGKRIKEKRAVVAEKIAGRLAEGVLQGLNYLHSRQTIHRDIKPSNILLSREGIVKLCDFGVSGELVNSLAGTFTGTSYYMAPERIHGDPYTITSDVWSTGITLLELVQNRHPFPSELSYFELMMHINAQGNPPSLEDDPPAVWSDAMKDFIKQALNPDAQKRPYPRDLLSHPWIVGIMAKEIHMASWIRQIWDWPKPTTRKPKDTEPGSRPSSSHKSSFSSTGTSSEPESDGPPKASG